MSLTTYLPEIIVAVVVIVVLAWIAKFSTFLMNTGNTIWLSCR